MASTYKYNIHLSKLDLPLRRYDISKTKMIDCCVFVCCVVLSRRKWKIRDVPFDQRYWRVVYLYRAGSTTTGWKKYFKKSKGAWVMQLQSGPCYQYLYSTSYSCTWLLRTKGSCKIGTSTCTQYTGTAEFVLPSWYPVTSTLYQVIIYIYVLQYISTCAYWLNKIFSLLTWQLQRI